MGLHSLILKVIKPFLFCRIQNVHCLGYAFQTVSQTPGIPPGAVLEPSLCLLFINKIVQNLNIQHFLYADDLKLFCIIDSLRTAKNYSLMLLNLIIGIFDYSLQNTILSRPVVNLDVYFDSKLAFSARINKCITSSYRVLGFIIRNMDLFNGEFIFKLMFSAFILSKLESASVIWSSIYDNNITLLEALRPRFFKSASFFIDKSYSIRGAPQGHFTGISSVAAFLLDD